MAAPAVLKIDILTDASKVQSEVGKIEGTGSKIKSWAKGIGAAIGTAFAIDFAKDAIKSASDLNETMNKTDVVFGKNAKSVQNWSRDAATSMGLSQQEALAAASSFGTLFQQVGIGGTQAVKMSEGIVQISSDLASFHNVAGGAAEVTDMISAAMRGEYDSLQRLVPTINAAAVEHKALEMTGKANAKELTAAEKAAATYQLVLEGAGPAAGDFARTSGDLANQQRIASAQFKDAQAALGQALLPALTKVMQFINDNVVPAFQWLAQNNLVVPILGFAAAIWVLNAALAANPIVLIVIAIVAFIAALVALWANWDKVWTWIMEHKAIAIVIGLLNPLVLWIFVIVGALKFLAANWDTIWNAIQTATAAVVRALIAVWNTIQPALQVLYSVFASIWGAISRVVGTYVEMITSVIRRIVDAFNWVKDAAQAMYMWVSDKFRALAGVIQGVVGAISGAVSGIVNAIKGPLNAVIRAWNNLGIPGFDFHIDLPGPIPDIDFHWNGISLPNIPELASGGLVARTGLALVHKGETFSGVGRSLNGPTTVNITVETTGLGADAPQIQRAVANALRGYARRNGPIDIPVAGAV